MAILGAVIVRMVKTHEHTPPREEVVFIRLNVCS